MTFGWAAERLGIELVDDDAGSQLRDLVGVAVRRNPRRAHLLVSTVLGKHIPVAPREVIDAGQRLGRLVAAQLGGVDALVMGYAETATGLGHLVADSLHADYLHSTRRDVDQYSALVFDEAHSHAPRHLLAPEDPELIARPDPVVLVDDELSTGRTALNTIRALQAYSPRAHYVIASLVDVRDDQSRRALRDAAMDLGVRIDVVSLASGRVLLPDGSAQRAADIANAVPEPQPLRAAHGAGIDIAARWTEGVRESGRHGFRVADSDAAWLAARECAAHLAPNLGDRVLVLGTEELMYAPLLIADELQQLAPSTRVLFSSTTRSPVVALDEPGYPIRTALTFASTDVAADGAGMRYAYNVAPASGERSYTDIVLVIDDDAVADQERASALVGQLAQACPHVRVVVLPTYRPAVVGAGR
jgi:adenine/guanine phosphoribosyltransferase-like PRPP-binding protein